ncbi:PREDICTED: rab-like protein 3 isoform X2 [Amphimedon queenslandica]|uniref:Rab-like protein 3 n=2 Tax=Amphimedon queenslandica TaxID=400682 RepID=A0AAN0JN30_AMPQE|nr:PREDICTED: rab-like protein 3 isoform X2 [Amphimedon queenslandica]|eukprot:XP_019858412.1 PREDICTED: rab-like protein 3 isoform X2 [Amphimedon queenslandica]
MATDYRKVKILVLGDSGVGKSSLVHVITEGEVLANPVSTVGCVVDVKLHEYSRSMSSSPVSFFVEFWDVGGSMSHEKGRGIFYQQANGVILVHDSTNRKSHNNLSKWLTEYHRYKTGRTDSLAPQDTNESGFDPEKFIEQEVPLLIVGTKEDQVSGRRSPPTQRSGNLLGANSITMNCKDIQHFSLSSQQFIETMKFIDKAVEHKYYPSLRQTGSSLERRLAFNRRQALNTQT